MIVGLGIDVVENRRLRRELALGDWETQDGVFSAEEIQRCRAHKDAAVQFAACFAAKEAALKALGVAPADLGMLREVRVGPGGIVFKRRLKSEAQNLGVQHITLAITSTKRHTGAMVILES